MDPIQVNEDILPIGEFKTHASRLLKKLRDTRRPLVITQNGRPAAVLITPEDFDRLRVHGRFVEAVNRGLADSEAGRTVADEDLDAELDVIFGPARSK
ncbi:MAG: type II toxin-antitoxin system Phd/YefM family antitoxin [Candidatus Sericytochromatia bacterium]|uniref:Antitoxin n=1 Tax=Candidatus Tanganyikabacteria bacterium TaxID=2961651 RepID=A0A938BJR6_9BACT|nr:type II toxin-antitoxin system Phd/YefM family antitoxin [Candidatus Tanganyikabacteria bacterium]